MTFSVLITGADRGLGRAFAECFAARRWRVFAGCRSRAAEARIPAGETGITALPLDVTDLGEIERAARFVAEQVDGLDLLINNAAINPEKDVALAELDFDVVRDVLDVNALGPLRVTQKFVPLMERGTKKTILNVSSEAGSLSTCGRTSWFGYCMSKAALNIQTRILENDLGRRGFKVFAVHPGWMRTGMSSPEAPLAPEESAERIAALLLDGELELAQFFQYDGTSYPW